MSFVDILDKSQALEKVAEWTKKPSKKPSGGWRWRAAMLLEDEEENGKPSPFIRVQFVDVGSDKIVSINQEGLETRLVEFGTRSPQQVYHHYYEKTSRCLVRDAASPVWYACTVVDFDQYFILVERQLDSSYTWIHCLQQFNRLDGFGDMNPSIRKTSFQEKFARIEPFPDDEDENEDRLRPSELCMFCYENRINCVFIPCGHHISCVPCSMKLESRQCPICRQRIQDKVQTYGKS